jgi:twitching motility protein PilT
MDIVDLMKQALNIGASDLHLVVGIPPSIRVDGQIGFLKERELTPDDTQDLFTVFFLKRKGKDLKETGN